MQYSTPIGLLHCPYQTLSANIVYIKRFLNFSLVALLILKELTSLKRNLIFDASFANFNDNFVGQPEEKEDDLNPADDGESSEESHGSSDETQLGFGLDLFVSLNVVKGCRVKIDLHHQNCGIMSLLP